MRCPLCAEWARVPIDALTIIADAGMIAWQCPSCHAEVARHACGDTLNDLADHHVPAVDTIHAFRVWLDSINPADFGGAS